MKGCQGFIGIVSRPEGHDSRQAIRHTWLKELLQLGGYQYRFFIGHHPASTTTTRTTGEEEGDVVRLPYIDTYYNLSIKTAHLLHYATTTDCPVVIKCDDDVYLHPQRFHQLITKALPRYHNNKGIYLGHMLTSQAPVRDPKSKWYLSAKQFKASSFPTYAEGPLYLLSSDVIERLPYSLVQVGEEKVPSTYLVDDHHRSPLFRFEDVFLGEMIGGLPPLLQPRYIDLPVLYQHANESQVTHLPRREMCTSSSGGGRKYVGMHDLSPKSMEVVHETVLHRCHDT